MCVLGCAVIMSNIRVTPYCLAKGWISEVLVIIFAVITLRPIHGVSASLSTSSAGASYHTAFVNITYHYPGRAEQHSEKKEMGRYGVSSCLGPAWGWVVHVRDGANRTDGCLPAVNAPRSPWVALVSRGTCKFHQKIYNAAKLKNASAVVIYNDISGDRLLTMQHQVEDVVSIFVSHDDGSRIASLVDNGSRVLMRITVGAAHTSAYSSINKTSVLFVSIAFIVLMVISLAWLVFYYVQRFRYAHAKQRLSNRLMHAAKKAINKMPTRTLKSGDKETDPEFDPCAVCIEAYKVSEQIRILPCKHVFHKLCVDPWLIEQRSCPMCKQDILKPFGLQVAQPFNALFSNTTAVTVGVSEAPSTPPPSTTGAPGAAVTNAIEMVCYSRDDGRNAQTPDTGVEVTTTTTAGTVSDVDSTEDEYLMTPQPGRLVIGV